MWLPHLGQRLSAERKHENTIAKRGKGLSVETQSLSTEREHGNAEDRFAIAVREHSDTRADEDVS